MSTTASFLGCIIAIQKHKNGSCRLATSKKKGKRLLGVGSKAKGHCGDQGKLVSKGGNTQNIIHLLLEGQLPTRF